MFNKETSKGDSSGWMVSCYFPWKYKHFSIWKAQTGFSLDSLLCLYAFIRKEIFTLEMCNFTVNRFTLGCFIDTHTYTHRLINILFGSLSLYKLKIWEGNNRVLFLSTFYLNTSNIYTTKIQSGIKAVILRGRLGGEEMVPWTFWSRFAKANPRFKSIGSPPGFPPNPVQLRSQSVIIFVLSIIFLKHVPFPALYRWCSSVSISLSLKKNFPFLFLLSKDHSTKKKWGYDCPVVE